MAAFPSCDVSLVDLPWEHLKNPSHFVRGCRAFLRETMQGKNENGETKMKTRQFDHLLAKEPVNIKRTNQECAGLPPPLGNRCRPQKIKCNRGIPKEINQKNKDFLQDIKPGIHYPARGKIKRNPKSMQIG